MAMSAKRSKPSGGAFLAKKSDLTKARRKLPPITDFLIVEDETFDADRLRATLRAMFGYEVLVRVAATLGSAIDCVIESKPGLIFLDDYLKPNDTASTTIPFLRHCGYEGPIVIVSSLATRKRRAELLAAGAADVIHKDNLDTVRISKALTGLFNGKA